MKKYECICGRNFEVRRDGTAVSFFGSEVFYDNSQGFFVVSENEGRAIISPDLGELTDVVKKIVERVEELAKKNNSEGIVKLSPTMAIGLFLGGVITIDNLEVCEETSNSIVTTLEFDDFLSYAIIENGIKGCFIQY